MAMISRSYARRLSRLVKGGRKMYWGQKIFYWIGLCWCISMALSAGFVVGATAAILLITSN
jgi:hypothetical protein